MKRILLIYVIFILSSIVYANEKCSEVDTWRRVNPVLPLTNYTDMTWSPELKVYVAIGYSRPPQGTITQTTIGNFPVASEIHISSDGINWNAIALAHSVTLNSIVWNSQQFVLVGGDGNIMTSTDGSFWQEQTSGVAGALHDIAWNGNRFVAVGENGTILTSNDAILWHQQQTKIDNTIEQIIWDGSRFLAFFPKFSSGRIFYETLTSNNGIVWKNSSTSQLELNSMREIVWDGNQYIIIGENYSNDAVVLSSFDGNQWETELTSSFALQDMIRNQEHIVIVGDEGTKRIFITRTANKEWKEQVIEVGSDDQFQLSPIAASDGKNYIVKNSTEIFTSSDANQWHLQPTLLGNNHLNDIVWNGQVFVAVGNKGTILSSTNGFNWQKEISGTTQSLEKITWNGQKFISVGSKGTILTSTNARLWTKQNSGTDVFLRDIAWSRTKYIVVGGQSVYDSDSGDYIHTSIMLTSPDSVHWTEQDLQNTTPLYVIEGNGDGFVASGYKQIVYYGGSFPQWPNILLESEDGRTWSKHEENRFAYDYPQVIWNEQEFLWFSLIKEIIHWQNNHYLRINSLGNLEKYDGKDVYETLDLFDQAVNALSWNGEQFVAVGNNGSLYLSNCGKTPTCSKEAAFYDANHKILHLDQVQYNVERDIIRLYQNVGLKIIENSFPTKLQYIYMNHPRTPLCPDETSVLSSSGELSIPSLRIINSNNDSILFKNIKLQRQDKDDKIRFMLMSLEEDS